MSEKLVISIGEGRKSENWIGKKVTWEWMVDRCRQFRIEELTYDQFIAAKETVKVKTKDGEGFVGGKLNGKARKKANVTYRDIIALDADFASLDFWEKFKKKFDCAALIYSTFKHTKEAPRYRLLIPTDDHMWPEEYEPICRWVASELGIENFDASTYAIERFMYFPARCKGADWVFEYQDGPFLSVEKTLAEYDDYLDVKSWAFGEKDAEHIRIGMDKVGDPLTKPKWIGAFNRCFYISDVIPEFLDDVYTLDVTSNDYGNRYSYTKGTSYGGLVVYKDLLVYSHHGTDPAGGKTLNAFDLVRIHKFGDLDHGIKENAKPDTWPSQKAMIEFVRIDERVKQMYNEENIGSNPLDRFKNITEENSESAIPREKTEPREPAPLSKEPYDPNWLGKLDMEKNMTYSPTHKNYQLILENDPGLRGRIGFNLFAGRTEVRGGLPWDDKTVNRGWEDDDLSMMRVYIGKKPYEMQRTPKMEDCLALVRRKNAFHPVKDYLESLEWDGVERLDTLLIDFHGAADTEYVREVTRRWFIAAVYRIYEPGIKFDEQLVLVGDEGSGKSRFFKLMGGAWYTASFHFGLLTGGNGKMAYEVTQGNWIVEVPEMVGLSFATAQNAKAFMAAEEDTYRPSHKAETIKVPRSWIPCGTSNDFDFIQGGGGNRRIWPVDVLINQPKLSVYDDLNEELRGLIWAEAMQGYLRKERIHLTNKFKELAKLEQIQHEQSTGMEHDLLNYLKMGFPDNFDQVDKSRRRDVVKNGGDKTGFLLEQVCVSQIWNDLFEEDAKKRKKSDSININNMMRKMKGWKEHNSLLNFGVFGWQRGFIRV